MPGEHRHSLPSSPWWPHGQGCVALLPSIEFKELRHPAGSPKEIVTLGDHLLAARLNRQLLQKDVGNVIGVSAWTVMNWEKNYHEPGFIHYPSIMEFLGYCPVQRAEHLGGWVKLHRIHRGLSQKEAAHLIGIDPSTLARYERDKCTPNRNLFTAMEYFIVQPF